MRWRSERIAIHSKLSQRTQSINLRWCSISRVSISAAVGPQWANHFPFFPVLLPIKVPVCVVTSHELWPNCLLWSNHASKTLTGSGTTRSWSYWRGGWLRRSGPWRSRSRRARRPSSRGRRWRDQSRQSAKLFSSRRNWDSPNPSSAGECAPPPLVPGGGAHSLARKGVGESQFRRGDIHCGTLYIYVLCGVEAGWRALAAPRWQEGHHHCPGQDHREGFQG